MAIVKRQHSEAQRSAEMHPTVRVGSQVRALLATGGGVVGALIVCAWLLANFALTQTAAPICRIGEKEDVGCARGFQAREHDAADRAFRWTDRAATIALSGAGYGAPRAVALELAAARPPEQPLPHVVISTGTGAAAFVAETPPRRYVMLLPSSFPYGDIDRVTINSETMTTPNGRHLGVVVYDARILRLGEPTLAGPLLMFALLAIGLSGALIATSLQHTVRALPAFGVGLVAILLAITAWLWQAERVAPLLPAGAALVATGTLGLHWLARRERAASMPWRTIVGIGVVVLLNGFLDWIVMQGIFQRQELPWIVIAQTLVTLVALWWLGRTARVLGFSLTLVLATALAVRLLAFAVRVLTGRVPNDADTELFYNYGRATIEIGVPEVEYPSGALVVWAALALPGSRELFLLLAPLLNLACDLVIAWGIWWLGTIAARRANDSSAPKTASYAALCYALSPLLLPFWHGKFDPVPAMMMILGLVAFAAERPWWAGVALGVGGTFKWAPWLSMPFPGWAWLRLGSRRWPDWPRLMGYVGGVLVGILVFSLPFALMNLQMFLQPYLIQGERQFIGESIWYPIALIFEPALQERRAPPYAGLPSAYLSNKLMVGVQLLVLVLLGLVQVLRPQSWRRTLVLTALAPTLFFLLNRVFSPQYAVIIVACLYAAAVVVFSLRQIVLMSLLVTIMLAANQLVWPYTQSYWLWPSIINLGLGIAISIWLAIAAARRGDRR